jgi:uncharacterized protein (DUF736 family)
MSYENKPGSGKLFKREKRGPNSPDWGGPFYETIGGVLVEREISAWENSSKKGDKYFSVQVKDKFVPTRIGPPVERAREADFPQPTKAAGKDIDDEIPF